MRVQHEARGGWSVAMPDRGDAVMVESLQDARRIAYRCAARSRPAELIVHDAYHRVCHRELLDGRGAHNPAARAPSG